MGDLNPTQTVIGVIDDIERGRYQLPSIQRQFVWGESQVLRLLDSILCGYPIGAVIVWKPNQNIRCRQFITDYNESAPNIISMEPLPGRQKAYMVLDGQQRLQSLFISFRGSYNGERAYLKIDELADESEFGFHYCFDFLTTAESAINPAFVHVNELAKLRRLAEIRDFVFQRLPQADVATRELAEDIVSTFVDQFVRSDDLLLQEIEDSLDYGQVLEVFERVNSGGTKLSKSDLIFSTVTLKIPDMEDRIRRMVDGLNDGGRHDFDTDFVIKAAFVIFGMRAKYDYKKIMDNGFLDGLAANFDNFEKAVTGLRVWMHDKALIKASRFLRSKLALIPLLDYLMLNEKYLGPDDGDENIFMRQYLYMAFFTRLFSRAPDSVLDQLHDIVVKAHKDHLGLFPTQEISQFIAKRRGENYEFRDSYLWDLDLTLNIIDGGVLVIPTQRTWSLERDHIFPRHQLELRGIKENVNSIGNFRLLGKSRNISKSDKMPDSNTDFFGKDDKELANLYRMTYSNLTQENFTAFVQRRKDLIYTKIACFLGFIQNNR